MIVDLEQSTIMLVRDLELFPRGEAIVEIPKPDNVKEPPPGTKRFQERVVFAASLVMA